MVKIIDSKSLMSAIHDNHEIAIIDPREEGQFGREHILHAVNIPLSRFELNIRDLVPRLSTRLVLCDGDDGFSQRAIPLLEMAGYTDIRILENGTNNWKSSGFEVFSGRFTPSQAFGEFLSLRENTRYIEAEVLKTKIDSGEKVLILDSRPPDEFSQMSIPGGINCPVAELVYRIHDLAPDPETLLVVNCAGKTRSIIGAQSLIYAGVPNPVAALKHGTMGWALAGLRLSKDVSPTNNEAISAQADIWGREAALKIAKRFGVKNISRDELINWQRMSTERSLYILDVRFPAEYAAGHIPGSRPAPGGQILGSCGHYIATQKARIVLVDDNSVRATVVAAFLLQQGWQEVRIFDGEVDKENLEYGPYLPVIIEQKNKKIGNISATKLAAELSKDSIQVLDCASSLEYYKGHIPKACWVLRSRIRDDYTKIPKALTYVLTSTDGQIARLASHELTSRTGAEVLVLTGGTTSWIEAGLPINKGLELMVGIPDDSYTIGRLDDPDPTDVKYWRYINWQTELVEKTKRDGTLKFPSL